MNNKRLQTLLTKFQENTCTADELQELELWYSLLNSNNQFIDDNITAAFSNEMLLQFKQLVKSETPVVPIYRRAFFRMAVAASIIILLGAGIYMQFFNNIDSETLVTQNSKKPYDIPAPNTTKATITLADGQTVLLDTINSGMLAKQGNVNVVKTADGQIIYNGSATDMQYNTLFNPRGSKVVSLTLSDGTKVWLNSESSLRYPIAFNANERKVEITGEAYFEVAKDANKKFLVDAKGILTEVFGTHFNVNTYNDETNTKITLLEGSVRVTRGTLNSMLKPGQQAIVGNNNDIRVVDNVDLDQAVAWKNGLFYFNRADLQMVMQQIARWYNVDISYEGNIKPREFWGKISRNSNASEVLKVLELSKVHFRIDGNKIIVMP